LDRYTLTALQPSAPWAITSYLYRCIYIDGIIAILKKEGWIEDQTFIPWTGTGGSQDGVCRFTKAGEGHDVEIIRYYPKDESSYYEAVSVPKMR
jgi:hypothetical protein